MVSCDLASCSQKFTSKKCKCYTSLDELQLKGLPEEERTNRINSNQFCAVIGDDGFLYGCDKGCCEGGCPGQCEGVAPRPPTGVYQIPIEHKTAKIKTRPIIQLIFLVALVLILLAVFSLFINRRKVPATKYVNVVTSSPPAMGVPIQHTFTYNPLAKQA